MQPRLLTTALLLVVCVATDLVALQPVWAPAQLVRGQYQRAYFELLGGVTGLAIDEAQDGYMAPEVELDRRGRLSVPPGRTIAVPIEDGAEYIIWNEGRSSAPYVVIGVETPLAAAPGPDTRDSRPFRFGGARVLELRDGELTWTDWDASRPWGDDRTWLRSLTDACNDGRRSPSLSIRQEGAALVARLGRCSLRSALPTAPEHGENAFAVVAGPNWAAVERPREGWRTAGHVVWWFVAAVIAATGLLYVGFGMLVTAILSAWVGLLSLFGPVPAVLGFFVAVAAAVAGSLWAATGLVLRTRPMTRIAALAALCAGLIGYPVVVVFRAADLSVNRQELRFERARNACGLIGYSTVRGDTLRRGTVGAWAYLDGECTVCSGATARYAKEAQTLDWVRDTTCAPSFTLQPGGALVFLGGGNDDFFWRKSVARQAFRFIGLLHYAYQRPDEPTWQRFVTATSEGSLEMIGEQTAAIRQLATCTRARGQRLLFVHDFLIWDLEEGRSAPRRAMLEQRRAAVDAAGGRFVDALEALGPKAGVSWFNDFIHPSAIGHLRIGELICRTLATQTGDGAG
jgi:hypothetical protein